MRKITLFKQDIIPDVILNWTYEFECEDAEPSFAIKHSRYPINSCGSLKRGMALF
jgi:hypothetical protein